MGAGTNDPAAVIPAPSPRPPPASSLYFYVRFADQLQTNIKANTAYFFICFFSFFFSSFPPRPPFFLLSLAGCFSQDRNSNKGKLLLTRTRSSGLSLHRNAICSQKQQCQEETRHVHKYVSKSSMSTLQALTNKNLTWKLQSFLLKAIIQSCSWAHLHQAQNSPKVPTSLQPMPEPSPHQQHQPGYRGEAIRRVGKAKLIPERA